MFGVREIEERLDAMTKDNFDSSLSLTFAIRKTEQKLDQFTKENFDLRSRIKFLDERLLQVSDGEIVRDNKYMKENS